MSLTSLSLKRRYTTSRDDLIESFFVPCLDLATHYDRAVGFFSSSFYVVVGLPLAAFARRGGTLRLVCCPRLTAADIDAISEGYEQRAADEALVEELDEVLGDPTGRAAASLLATLVAAGTVDIKIAFRPGAQGIFHDKVGIFTDGEGARVSFDGSSNETWSAWSGGGNHEAFHAFTSWLDPERVSEDVDYFEALWEGSEAGVLVRDFPEVARARLEEVADPDGIDSAEARLNAAIGDQSERRKVREPERPALREHQASALNSWAEQRHRGILEHATGSGKTITGLAAMERAFESGLVGVVLVPTVVLQRQWEKEIREYFGAGALLMQAGGGHGEWRSGSVLRDFCAGDDDHRILLATMDTASSPDFIERIRDLPDLLLIADEVHRLGSPSRRSVLGADARWRLGMSATWEREGDPDGTEALREFFGEVLDPRYSLADAIRDGHLCSYRYFVHLLSLDEDERQRWRELSRRVAQALGGSDAEMTESARQLLIQRSRIIKNASGKPALAGRLLRERFDEGQAWLVYCDDSDQLWRVRAAVEGQGLHCFEFHTQATGDDAAALAEFERSGGIMLAIRCLDEGVDIPSISHALILASSTTRREFIQRRGRVLRQHDTKLRAEIHDLVVDAAGFDSPESVSFLRTEISRAREFCDSAVDSRATRNMLDGLAEQAGIPATDRSQGAGFESDEEEPSDG